MNEFETVEDSDAVADGDDDVFTELVPPRESVIVIDDECEGVAELHAECVAQLLTDAHADGVAVPHTVTVGDEE